MRRATRDQLNALARVGEGLSSKLFFFFFQMFEKSKKKSEGNRKKQANREAGKLGEKVENGK